MENKISKSSASKKISICIFRLSAIGDVCLMIPTVKAIQRSFPEAKLTWIISNPAYQLVKDLPGIKFIVINKPRSLKDYLKLYRQLGDYRFDIVLATQASMRVNLLYPALKSARKIGFDKQRARDMQWLFTNENIEFKNQHLLDSFLAFAAKIGATVPKKLPSEEMEWDIPLSDKDISEANKILAVKNCKYHIAINPITSKAERNWGLNRYATLIDTISSDYDCHIILTGGSDPKELTQIQTIAGLCQNPNRITNCAGTLNLKQLAALLGQVDCLISPDTAAVHIASAMKTDVIGLYAVAPAKLSGPYFSKRFTIDKFEIAIEKFLNTKSENIQWKTRVHDPRAMQLIQVDDVLSKLSIIFDKDYSSSLNHRDNKTIR